MLWENRNYWMRVNYNSVGQHRYFVPLVIDDDFSVLDDDIRQNEGFKNVSLGNVIPAAYKESVIPFLNNTDKQLLEKYRVPAFEVRGCIYFLAVKN